VGVIRQAVLTHAEIMTFDEDFPSLNGFSAANLWRMTNFYEAYGTNEKTRTACVRNWLVPQHHQLGKMPGRSGARVLHPELLEIWLDPQRARPPNWRTAPLDEHLVVKRILKL
jgi:hypothetical protein